MNRKVIEFTEPSLGVNDQKTAKLSEVAVSLGITTLDKIKENVNKLFKPGSYDMRAYVGEPGDFFNEKALLTPDVMKIAGVLMGSLTFKNQAGESFGLKPGDTVVVGKDNGPTSTALSKAFAEGLMSQGINVIDIGTASSGEVYQAQELFGAQGHLQITRSHVEVTTNGGKFAVGLQGIHTYLLKQMNEAITSDLSVRNLPETEYGTITDGSAESMKLYQEKMQRVYGDYFANRDNSKMAVNLFGGTGPKYADFYRSILGADAELLGENWEELVNAGLLIADPTRLAETLKKESEKAIGEQNKEILRIGQLMDQGIDVHSFDLDADRGALNMHLGDDQAYMLADYKLNHMVPQLESKLKEKGVDQENIDQILDIAKTVYIDARYTSGVKEIIESLGGKTVYHTKGHSLWKETLNSNMNKIAELAGFSSVPEFVQATGYRDYQIEASVHLFASDAEDGIYRDDAVENVLILEQVKDALGVGSVEEYFENITPKHITKEIRTTAVNNEVKDVAANEIIDVIRSDFKGKEGYTITEFQGQIRVDMPNGFIMYGVSNTSPKYTFMVEGNTIEDRNNALAYLQSLHNEIKAKHGDDTPMDLGENSFYVDDASYEMAQPDQVVSKDPRVVAFKAQNNIE